MLVCIFFFFFLRFYLFMRDQRETQAEGEAGPCREPNVGLDPGTPGSCPGLKAGAKPLSHPGIPHIAISKNSITSRLIHP